MPSPHRPATGPVGYAAFVQLHRHGYERYARARLGDRSLATTVVAQVLRRAELNWSAALRGDPAALTWDVLRESVTTARGEAADAPADDLHRTLPDRPADAALLHERLGMTPKAAAALMGLGEPELQVQLRAARRILAELDPGGRNGGA
ncbi:hypothetical protein [Kitasatospora purpeofusca]|uniref:hypothetical protein n=1 Tax=Kitasatospora purpeofusca TaxID=67352 RepID=UPI0022515A58|nr:hypothetical protein [Kitasatospora purpeofusca]MCX4755320.1 hypothetical protein [Kitasatospora purpeofusca]WSR36804.1 hypothetical protein OG715_41060 [Kitasatospora purpeofusca]WSR45087.1 hypothetical protein OG196_41935 [Kitasatospora purpeofusca]